MLNRRTFFKGLGLTGLISTASSRGSNASLNEQPILRFAVASDGHYGQEGTPYEMYYRHIVRWLNAEQQDRGLDLVIFNGDLIHDDPVYLPQVKEALDQLTVPYYAVRGNHDRVSQEVWQTTWGYPTNHAFIFQDQGFILADTSNEQGEYLCADVTWLRERLTNYQPLKNVFVVLHISQFDWTTYGVACPEVMNLLASQSNVKAVFHGHDHQEDDVKRYQGKPFLYSGHLGGSWGVEYKGYRIIEVYPDNSMHSYQVNPIAKAKLYEMSLS